MPRKRYSEEQIVGILKESASGVKTGELVRKYGININTFYNWREKYSGMTVPDVKRLKSLEEENRRLKMIVGDLTLDLKAAKEILSKNW